MDSPIIYNINKEKSKKLYTVAMLLFCSLPILLNCVFLVPLYINLQSNITFSSGILVTVIKYVQDFFDLTAFAVSYALIIFSALLITKKRTRSAILIYTISFASRIVLRLIMNIFIYGTLGTSDEILVDFIYLGVYFLLEMLQLGIVYWFAVTDANKFALYIERSNKKARKKGGELSHCTTIDIFPFTKLVNWYNPLQRSALKMSIFITAIKIFTRILNDITIGAPISIWEVLIMVVYYLSDLLYGVVAYIMALITFNVVYDKLKYDKNKETDEESSPSVLE